MDLDFTRNVWVLVSAVFMAGWGVSNFLSQFAKTSKIEKALERIDGLMQGMERKLDHATTTHGMRLDSVEETVHDLRERVRIIERKCDTAMGNCHVQAK